MKKKTPIKIFTIIILVIATISLVFGSFIMLFGASGEPEQRITSTTVELPTQE